MAESINSESTVRDYLLGRVTDETTLQEIEERLFSDEEFCAQMELAEDEIINDYVLGRLSKDDANSFAATLTKDPERRLNVELTQGLKERARLKDIEVSESKPSLLQSLAHFFRQPAYVGAFALLLIAAVALAIYFTRRDRPDDLAELRSFYRQSRPTETRLSGFDYAPFSQLRGEPDQRQQDRLRGIELNLIRATQQSPSANSYYALGTFYVAQNKPREAIRELEAALKFDERNARIHNELGAAHFHLAMTGATENKLAELGKAHEQFTRATELDGSLLEALFNKSLTLQEMNLPRRAKESWTLYLQRDSSSPWADEARKNLSAIKDETSFFKTDAQVLSDFLAAFRQHDEAQAKQIHNETKGLLGGPTVPIQLARRYLTATRAGDIQTGRESLDALMFIGKFEQSDNQDSFFLSWRTFI